MVAHQRFSDFPGDHQQAIGFRGSRVFAVMRCSDALPSESIYDKFATHLRMCRIIAEAFSDKT